MAAVSEQIVPHVIEINRSPSSTQKKCRFAVFGDPHVYSSRLDRPSFAGFRKYQESRMYWPTDVAFEKMVQALNEAGPDFVLGLGDMADFADRREMELYMSLSQRLSMPLYNALGNHDLSLLKTTPDGEGSWTELEGRARDATIELWKEIGAFPARYYSFSRSGYHFVALDNGTLDDLDDEQFAWLEADLSAHRARPTFLFCHRPLSHLPLIPEFEKRGRQITPQLMYKFARPRKEFFDLIGEHGDIKIVFCGSVHFTSQTHIGNITQRTLAGAFEGVYDLVECY